MPIPPAIRPIALAVIRRADELLVSEGHDPVRDLTFFRPLGGGIEFGEPAETALRRELREEIAVELSDVDLLAVVENIFTFEGRPGHEIVFVFSATIADPGFLARDDPGTVLDNGSPLRWLPRSDVEQGRATLFPAEIVRLLAGT